MRVRFNEQLSELNNEMTKMCNMIEKAILDTIDAFFGQNVNKAQQIMKDDGMIDQTQKKIENICFQILFQQQPVAGDLRNVTAAMKMVTDMERIGDLAADICEMTVFMVGTPYPKRAENIKKMSMETVWMLQRAVESYTDRNIDMAREVIAHDDVVDKYFLSVRSDLIKVVQNDSDHAEQAADLMMVNKYLERIGDHATNIAEWVIFFLENIPKQND